MPETQVRTLGFLFADLRGYTHFIDERGDAAAAELVHAYRGIARECIARFAGREISTEGDSFFVVFDSVSSAVRCGVELIARAGEHDPPIRLGVGVHAGEAAAGEDGYVAGPVNLAARLCAAAHAGDLLVSDTVQGLTRTAVEARYEFAGARRLKGFQEPVRLWRVDVPTAARSAEDDRPPRRLSGPMALALVASVVAESVFLFSLLTHRPFFGIPVSSLWPDQLVGLWIGLFTATLVGNLVASATVFVRSTATARVAGWTLVVAAVIAALATPYQVVVFLGSGLVTPLGAAFLLLFATGVVLIALATAIGFYLRRAWAIGAAYALGLIFAPTLVTLPMLLATLWAVRRRRENVLY